MNNEKLIDVLWIDDLTSIWDSYKAEAELEGLRLHPFASWEEAESQLKENYGKWSAIILDAKCKVKKDDSDGVDFLIPVLQELRGLAERFHHTIPWFVLSGDIDDSSIIDIFLRHSQRDWDPHMAPFYDKNTDTEELWSNIIAVSEKTKSHELAITHDLYREVFESLESCNLNPQVKRNLIDLLLPLHYSNDTIEQDDSYQKIRICIEYLFHSMIDMRLIPKELQNGGKAILTQCCYFLLNRPDKSQGYVSHEKIMSSVLATNIKYMIDVTGSKLHSEGADADKSKDIWTYIEEVANSPYLLRSFTLQLCDIILWYAKYLKTHDNPIENERNWMKKELNSEYEGQEVEIQFDSNGIAFYKGCMLPPMKETVTTKGMRVKLKEVQLNTRSYKDKYPFFAKYEIINR